MNVQIGAGIAHGSIKAPPSKSYAHRALICAALAKGKSVVRNIALSEDILATLDCIRALGAQVEITGNSVTVTGGALPLQNEFPCRESGSTLRFFLPLALLRRQPCVFSGSSRLMERPMEVYELICREQNLNYVRKNGKIEVCGQITAGNFGLRGDVSSQFITGLLFALPLLPKPSRIFVQSPFVSRPYVEMTLNILARFGICVNKIDELTFEIPGNQTYRPTEIEVEGDFSNAAFYEALNLLGGKVTVAGLNKNSAQGDRIYQSVFPQFLSGTPTVDLADCPDLAPVFMALGAAFHGVVLHNTARLKIKESDRGAVMATELSKFGIATGLEENAITVMQGTLQKPQQTICGQNDHRIVMACTLLLTRTGGVITGAEAVNKSNPAFFEDLQNLGIGVKQWN